MAGQRAPSGAGKFSAFEQLAIGASIVLASFLVIDPLVFGAVRTLDGATYRFFRSLTHLGRSNWILIPAGAGIVLLAALKSRATGLRRRVEYGYAAQILIFVFASIAVSGLSASLIKNVIGRARPKLFAEHGPLEFQPMTFDADFASFPSGHATTAGALAAVLAILYPPGRALFFLAGAWIASTRFLIGAHYVSDVVAGFGFGVLMVFALRDRLARRRWLFDGSKSGAVRLRGSHLLGHAAQAVLNGARALVPDSLAAAAGGKSPRQ